MFRFIGVMSTNEIIVKRKQTKGIANNCKKENKLKELQIIVKRKQTKGIANNCKKKTN